MLKVKGTTFKENFDLTIAFAGVKISERKA